MRARALLAACRRSGCAAASTSGSTSSGPRAWRSSPSSATTPGCSTRSRSRPAYRRDRQPRAGDRGARWASTRRSASTTCRPRVRRCGRRTRAASPPGSGASTPRAGEQLREPRWSAAGELGRRAAPGALAAQLRPDLGRARDRLPAARCTRTPCSSPARGRRRGRRLHPRQPRRGAIAPRATSPAAGELIEESLARFQQLGDHAGRGLRAQRARQPRPLRRRLRARPRAARAQPRPCGAEIGDRRGTGSRSADLAAARRPAPATRTARPRRCRAERADWFAENDDLIGAQRRRARASASVALDAGDRAGRAGAHLEARRRGLRGHRVDCTRRAGRWPCWPRSRARTASAATAAPLAGPGATGASSCLGGAAGHRLLPQTRSAAKTLQSGR